MEETIPTSGLAAFVLIYLTFFLDNVLLTVLVPIIPDWVRGGAALKQWTQHDAPLAVLLNSTVHQITTTQDDGGVGRAQAIVGVVLSTKAAVQLATAAPAAVAVCRYGPAKVLRVATGLLALTAILLWACSTLIRGVFTAWVVCVCVCVSRALHGVGAAAAAVAGLALAAASLPRRRGNALPALLAAVALGVLVGYPFGGLANSLWKPGTPFLMLAAAFVVDFGLQCMFLDRREFNLPATPTENLTYGVCSLSRNTCTGAAGASAGAVLLTTSVMAALEPCLPLWLTDSFGAKRWQTAMAFIPDSTGYFLAASSLGGYAKRVGAERVAITGQICVGVCAVCMGLSARVWALAVLQLGVGAGLGAVDAALVPALLETRDPRRAASRAALLQGSSSLAYVIGPVAGGAVAWRWGARVAIAALGVANLLYAPALYCMLTRHPLSPQWGATPESDTDEELAELTPLQYTLMK